MRTRRTLLTLEPQFLRGVQGELFTVYVAPPAGMPVHGAVLYCPPFGEEMNKCRRMAAMQARRLAAAGFGVLLPDLYGTGDSSGEFGDATWEIWLSDIGTATRSLTERTGHPVSLWGARLGAALALQSAPRLECAPLRVVLWQPVVKGAVYLTQFLRLRLAAQMMSGADRTTVKSLRETLRREGHLEVAGYALGERLACAIELVDLAGESPPPGCRVHWFEIGESATGDVSLPGRRVLDTWAASDCVADAATLVGDPFWQTPEIATAESLLDATSALFAADANA